jgi:hypothetical protein
MVMMADILFPSPAPVPPPPPSSSSSSSSSAPHNKCTQDAADQLDHNHRQPPDPPIVVFDETDQKPVGTASPVDDEDFVAFLRRASKTEAHTSCSSADAAGDNGMNSDRVYATTTVPADGDNGHHHHSQRYVTPKDFELLKVVGMGSFGKVLQVKNRRTGNVHAMKIISKRLLRRKTGYVDNILVEQSIMARIRHPFVVTMHCSFQTKEKLFLIMDFLAGGTKT